MKMHMPTEEQINTVISISDDEIIAFAESVIVTDEEIDRLMGDIRATLPVAVGTGGTGAYCCGAGGPNNTDCTTASPNNICSPSGPPNCV